METLLNEFNIVPNDMDLFHRAFIHSSYAYEHDLTYDYEKIGISWGCGFRIGYKRLFI